MDTSISDDNGEHGTFHIFLSGYFDYRSSFWAVLVHTAVFRALKTLY